MDQVEINKHSSNIQARIHMARSLDGCIEKFLSRREKPHRATEKPKLDNALELKGIDYVGFDDMELKDTMKNSRKSWKCEWNLQCRVNREIRQGVHPQRRLRTRLRQIATTTSKEKTTALPTQRKEEQYTHALLKPTNPSESALKRLNIKIMKITLLRRGFQFVESQQSCAETGSHTPCNEDSERKRHSRQGVVKIEGPASMARDESQKQKRGHRGTRRGQNSSLCDAHGLAPLDSELEPKFSNNTMAASYHEETL